MEKLAAELAALLKTAIIKGAIKEHDNGTITFVLVSGQKLTYTEAQLRAEIAKHKPAEEPQPKAKVKPEKEK